MTSEEKFKREKEFYDYFESDLKEVFEKHSVKIIEVQEPFYGGCSEYLQFIINGTPWINWDVAETLRNTKIIE